MIEGQGRDYGLGSVSPSAYDFSASVSLLWMKIREITEFDTAAWHCQYNPDCATTAPPPGQQRQISFSLNISDTAGSNLMNLWTSYVCIIIQHLQDEVDLTTAAPPAGPQSPKASMATSQALQCN